MVLKTHAPKTNGLSDGKYWYVAREYLDENNKPWFTMSLNRQNAHQFTVESANAFNEKYMKLGRIDSPFMLSE